MRTDFQPLGRAFVAHVMHHGKTRGFPQLLQPSCNASNSNSGNSPALRLDDRSAMVSLAEAFFVRMGVPQNCAPKGGLIQNCCSFRIWALKGLTEVTIGLRTCLRENLLEHTGTNLLDGNKTCDSIEEPGFQYFQCPDCP